MTLLSAGRRALPQDWGEGGGVPISDFIRLAGMMVRPLQRSGQSDDVWTPFSLNGKSSFHSLKHRSPVLFVYASYFLLVLSREHKGAYLLVLCVTHRRNIVRLLPAKKLPSTSLLRRGSC